jgi:hypothetical protein
MERCWRGRKVSANPLPVIGKGVEVFTIPKLPIDSFDWLRWIYGIDVWREIGVACMYNSIIERGDVLRKYAVGYIEGERLYCRPKENEFAVLFLINDTFCWTHFRKEEFYATFR